MAVAHLSLASGRVLIVDRHDVHWPKEHAAAAQQALSLRPQTAKTRPMTTMPAVMEMRP